MVTPCLCFLIFFREFYAGSFLQPWSSKKKRTASEVCPAVQFWPCSTCWLSMLPESWGAGALQPVSAVPWGPSRSELHSQHESKEQEELGGGWRHLVSRASSKVSEEECTPARQCHLSRGTKGQWWLAQSPTEVHPAISSSAALSLCNQQNRPPEVSSRCQSRSKASHSGKHYS